MPYIKSQVKSLEQKDIKTFASKFLRFLKFVGFIALNEKNGKLIFSFFSFKTLLNMIEVVFLFAFQMTCLFAFEHETYVFNFETIVEVVSLVLIGAASIIPILQPIILRYIKHTKNIFISYFSNSNCLNDLEETMVFKPNYSWPNHKKTLSFGR